ncbi:MAG: hypothetical protein R2860_16205 [Desulfobacterales bacterium]
MPFCLWRAAPTLVFAKPVAVTLYPNDAKIIEQFSAPVEAAGGQLTVQFAHPHPCGQRYPCR